MRKSIIVTFLIFTLMLAMTSSALAASKRVIGSSTGGSSLADVTGTLNYSHDSVTYSASASTKSTKTGKCYAKVTIYFNSTYDTSSKTVQSGTSVSTGTVNSQSYKATKATSTHSYESTTYGKWSGSVSHNY